MLPKERRRSMGAEADRCEAVMEALLKELGKAFSGHAFRGGGGGFWLCP
jgi:hypothetical protein